MTITIDVPQASPWRGILMVFALPLAGLMIGLIGGGEWPWLQHLLGLDAGMTGFVLGALLAIGAFLFAWFDDQRFTRRHPPRIVGVRRAS